MARKVSSRRDQGAWTGPWRRRALRVVTRRSPWVLANSSLVRDQLLRAQHVELRDEPGVQLGLGRLSQQPCAGQGLARDRLVKTRHHP